MFTTPIKHTPLANLDQLQNFSFRTNSRIDSCQVYWQNNGQIAFSDEYGNVFVTPYRSEITQLLDDAGFQEECISVPFSNGEDIPERYAWLRKIAERENWANTYEEAYAFSLQRGLTSVKIPGKYQIKQVESFYTDKESLTIINGLITMWLLNDSKENIGTYIIVDEKIMVICDEYGRTWLLKVKTCINDIVNTLIASGYRHNPHPEWYIKKYEPSVEDVSEN